MSTKTYQIQGLGCPACAKTVESRLSEVTGVDKVQVDLNQGQVNLRGNYLEGDLVKALEDTPYHIQIQA